MRLLAALAVLTGALLIGLGAGPAMPHLPVGYLVGVALLIAGGGGVTAAINAIRNP